MLLLASSLWRPHASMTRMCRAMMAEVTVAFTVCSEAINAAEAGLRAVQQDDLADMLRVLQINEQEKLRLTLILQALRQSYAHGTFSWQANSAAVKVQIKPGMQLAN